MLSTQQYRGKCGIQLSIDPSVYLSVHLYIYIYPSVYLSVHMYIYLSICISICPSIYLIYPSTYLSIYPSVYLSVHLYIYLSIYLSNLSIYLSSVVGWHHQFNGHELGQIQEMVREQEGLACFSPWGRKSQT